jgi:hypothetical protein
MFNCNAENVTAYQNPQATSKYNQESGLISRFQMSHLHVTNEIFGDGNLYNNRQSDQNEIYHKHEMRPLTFYLSSL